MFKIVQQRLKGSVTPIAKDRVSEIYQSKTLEGILALPCENGRIEFKQGMYDLSPGRKRVKLDKIAKTLVAIANLGPSGYDLNAGYLIVGVADTKRDADKINSLDGVKAPLISENYVVGLDREFNLSGKAIDSEAYLHMVRDDLHKEPISEPLKSKILSNLEMVTLYGQKLLVFRVEAIGKLSRYDNDVYVRDLDQTLKYKKADVMYLEDLIYEIRDKYRSALNH
nr:RNA-binding domain-containing protein [Corynebacterium meridianum]